MTCYIERRVKEKRRGRGRDESEDITADNEDTTTHKRKMDRRESV